MPGAEPRLRFRIHPLFFAYGIWTAFSGELMVFLAAAVAAVGHECAHAFAARRMGYTLDRIVLMPYGAVISGDIGGISPKQECFVCLAGPCFNAAAALFFVSLWWLYPETYPYTDTAAYVSVSLFLVNLLPAYPLDGGRMLFALLRPHGEARARRICLLLSLLCALAVLAYFIAGAAAGKPAWSALLFCIFLLAGMFGGGRYSRIRFSREKSFSRGVEERRVALSADRSVGYAVRFLREDKYLVLVLFRGEEFAGELTEEEFLRGVSAGDWTLPVGELLPEFCKRP